MSKKIFKFIYYWLPPIILMITIFILSSRQRIGVSDEYAVNFVVFKSLHMLEYALLYFLLLRAFYSASPIRLSLKQKFIMAIVLAISYGISDELHQSFVPTRQGHIRDIMIDSLGILLCFSYTKKNLHFLRLLL